MKGLEKRGDKYLVPSNVVICIDGGDYSNYIFERFWPFDVIATLKYRSRGYTEEEARQSLLEGLTKGRKPISWGRVESIHAICTEGESDADQAE